MQVISQVAFIDFEKAFDSILLKMGSGENYTGVLKNMYDDVKAKVRCGVKFRDYISCT